MACKGETPRSEKHTALCGLSRKEAALGLSTQGPGPGDPVLIANDIGDVGCAPPHTGDRGWLASAIATTTHHAGNSSSNSGIADEPTEGGGDSSPSTTSDITFHVCTWR